VMLNGWSIRAFVSTLCARKKKGYIVLQSRSCASDILIVIKQQNKSVHTSECQCIGVRRSQSEIKLKIVDVKST